MDNHIWIQISCLGLLLLAGILMGMSFERRRLLQGAHLYLCITLQHRTGIRHFFFNLQELIMLRELHYHPLGNSFIEVLANGWISRQIFMSVVWLTKAQLKLVEERLYQLDSGGERSTPALVKTPENTGGGPARIPLPLYQFD